MGAPARPQGLPATQKVYIDIPLNGAEARGASRLSTKNLRLQVSCHPRPPPPPCAPPQAAFSLSEPGAGFGARRPWGTLRRRRAHARSQRKSHTVALITLWWDQRFKFVVSRMTRQQIGRIAHV